MKIEVFDDNLVNIFINSYYFNNIDFDSKDDIVFMVKDLIIKYKSKLNLRGLYKVKVFVNKKIGFFINIIKLDDNLYNDIVDLKVIVKNLDKIYFKTDNYYILPENSKIYFFNNSFYCDIKNIENIYDVVDFGDYIFGHELNYILEKASII